MHRESIALACLTTDFHRAAGRYIKPDYEPSETKPTTRAGRLTAVLSGCLKENRGKGDQMLLHIHETGRRKPWETKNLDDVGEKKGVVADHISGLADIYARTLLKARNEGILTKADVESIVPQKKRNAGICGSFIEGNRPYLAWIHSPDN